MRRVMLISSHYLESKRKAGFHWLADAFWRNGWDVTFVTVPISWISWARRDSRLQYPILKEAGKTIRVQEHLSSYVLFTHWHPVDLGNKVANSLTYRFFAGYHRLLPPSFKNMLQDVDLFVFESTPGLLLYKFIKSAVPNARYVYRVSDDLRLLRCHPIVRDVEMEIASSFDYISVPSTYIQDKFLHLDNVSLDFHGIRKDLFDLVHKNPYHKYKNAIFVGNSHFDNSFFDSVAQSLPHWTFHIIGPISGVPRRDNIKVYGEIPFLDTIPYIKYADVGLQTRKYSLGSESLTDSLKVIQYTYCKLPIVAPNFLKTNREHMFYYDPSDPVSMKIAVESAYLCPKSLISSENVCSWAELAEKLGGGL